MSFTSMLNQTCSLSSPTHSPDGSGTSIDTWSVVANGVKCYSEHSTQHFLMANGRFGSVSVHYLYLPRGTNVQTGFKVQVSGDNATYLVTHCDLFHQHHIQAEMTVASESPQTP